MRTPGTLENIAQGISRTAYRAADEYMRANDLEASPALLGVAISEAVRAVLPGALAEMREASDLGMREAAMQGFTLAIAQAGIDAAREVATPKQSPAKAMADHAAYALDLTLAALARGNERN